jgi:hypothetical protein
MVVLVAVGALSYFGVLSPDKFVPQRCLIEAGIACTDFEVKDTFVDIALRNSMGEDITITNINISGCNGTKSGILNNGESKSYRISGCSHTTAKKLNGEINISYIGESGLDHIAIGKLSGKVSQSNSIQKTLDFKEDGSTTNTTYDAQVNENNPNTNYGSVDSVSVDGFSPSSHILIRFPNIIGDNEDQIPTGTQIDSATLTVNCVSTAESAPNAYRLLEDWVESEVTWNNRKTGVAWSDSGADGLSSHAPTAIAWDCQWPQGFKNFDMTSFVQSWADGIENNGVVLIDTSNDGMDFYTGENQYASNRPLLTVQFTVFN